MKNWLVSLCALSSGHGLFLVHLALNKLRMWDSCEQPGTFQAIVLQADRA